MHLHHHPERIVHTALTTSALIMAERGSPLMQVQLPGMFSRRMHAAQLSRNEGHAALLAQQRQTNHVQILSNHSASERANNVEDGITVQLEALLTSTVSTAKVT